MIYQRAQWEYEARSRNVLQHFWMLQDVSRIWPGPSRHLKT